ncbi:hypothetical protein ATO6_09645 [Oceanicola sp. 22II-s10i]|uniref:TetR/AcrR family transcriptional regulator n=1 Tax=Oceanicola sp. 22II-s10i TaxID=1317116 RepID=UPI000B526D9B|nr:TetR/AcrR family transcriptional regulator [Oceanicola sp. 22II-s10i]OWU85271.1 hypothetical protein ATO6_09645 [Oceanicola sp. 22II-s10i]
MDTTAKQLPQAQDDASDTSDRFRRKRDTILDAAAVIINERGLKGLTFVSVAEAVGLNTTSVTYYFKRKEMLAAATIERTIEQLGEIIDSAGQEPTAELRVKSFVRRYLELAGATRLGQDRPTALLSDLRALEEPQRTDLLEDYRVRVLKPAAQFFDRSPTGDGPGLNFARAHMMVDALYWSRAWLTKYSVGDYERAGQRLMDLFARGILPDGADWTVRAPVAEVPDHPEGADITPETYLHAATRLINERGYRGASVERIAGELNVSKGSFYHHLQGKDDLVLECFHRGYGRFSQAQRRAINLPGSHADRIAACIGDVLSIQFDAEFPLVRITALQALPADLRRIVLDRSDRIAMRFAGMISDGIAEGSIRPVDPLIAAQWVTGLMNSASDMRLWAEERADRATAIRLYSHSIAHGLFRPL